MDAWMILFPAFTLCALMIATHTYLGLHVLARGIIFVDLALAQVAALGVSVAFMLGWDVHGAQAQFVALGATLLAAVVLAKLRAIPDKTAREVIIGCMYVVATAAAIVILSRSSQGMEELKSMFSGNILWVRWEEVGLLALVYAVLTVLHVVYFRRFKALSFSEVTERKSGFRWELLFFVSFAVVITLAVNLAGVLMVFAFLIIPAFTASLLVGSFGARLALGGALAMGGSVAGLWLSFAEDLPAGPLIVAVLGGLPLLAGAALWLRRCVEKQRKTR
ncbi:MAG: metal ABC transporter permease [Gammaproteobacteria bacterium]|nr:metal ABC transporter permease [Gammaproteobacteria bacterium]